MHGPYWATFHMAQHETTLGRLLLQQPTSIDSTTAGEWPSTLSGEDSAGAESRGQQCKTRASPPTGSSRLIDFRGLFFNPSQQSRSALRAIRTGEPIRSDSDPL